MVCVDGTHMSEKAFLAACTLKKEDDELYIVHSVERKSPPYAALAAGGIIAQPALEADAFDKFNKQLEEDGKKLLEAYVKYCREHHIKHVHPVVISSNDAKHGIVESCEKHAVDTLFVGTHDYGAVKRFFLGSFSNYLSHHCPCNVMIVKDKDAESAAKIAASAANGGADKTA